MPFFYDIDAIHISNPNELGGISEKVSPASGDHFIIEDSAAGYIKKKVLFGNLGTGIAGNFGKDYQTAAAIARSTTTSASFQTKIALTTGALTGNYRIGWTCLLDVGSNNKEVTARLYNVTNASVFGAATYFRITLNSEIRATGGFSEVVFTGAAKTFEIQFASPDESTTVGIQNARIEFWRIS